MSLTNICIDRGSADRTVYTISHKEAFLMLERQVCAQFHGSGSYDTQTRATVGSDGITFTVTITPKETEHAG